MGAKEEHQIRVETQTPYKRTERGIEVRGLDATIRSIKEMFKYPRMDQFRGAPSIFQPVCVSLKPEEWKTFLIELEWLREHERVLSTL